MAFHNLSYSERFKIAGDPAENAFRAYAKKNGVSVERYGFDRSQLKQFWKLPEFVKATPDFVCIKKGIPFLVECKGVGRSNFVLIKDLTMRGLRRWSEETDLYFFVNDSHLNAYAIVSYQKVQESLEDFDTGYFDETKLYYKIPKSFLTWNEKDWEDIHDV